MSQAFLAGEHLLRLRRFDQAAKEFRRHLAQEPEDPQGHALLALCLLELKNYTDAKSESRQAVELAPDLPFGYYVLGRVYYESNQHAEARNAFTEAIRLFPTNPEFHGMLAVVELSQRKWQAALDSADKGLEFDPEDAICLNVRSSALTHLGRRDEAAQTMKDAIAHDPENAWSHANQGWAELHAGNPKKAMEYFRESLRLAPDYQWARSGIVEALKARNFIYRWMLGFFLWMSRLSQQWRWMVIIGVFFAPQILRSVGDQVPNLRWLTNSAVYVIIGFVLMTWIASPLFNLMLRLDPMGRYALSDDQRKGANLLAVVLFPSLALLLASLFLSGDLRLLIFSMGVCLLFCVFPAATLYLCDKGWPRHSMWAYFAATVLMAAVIIGQAVLALRFGTVDQLPAYGKVIHALAESVGPLFVYSPILSFFMAHWLTSARVRH